MLYSDLYRLDGSKLACEVYTSSKPEKVFYKDAGSFNNNKALSDITTVYPSSSGIFRTVGTATPGTPENSSTYGVLVIFKAASYGLHLYVDSSGSAYITYTGDASQIPSKWYKLTSTSVNAR